MPTLGVEERLPDEARRQLGHRQVGASGQVPAAKLRGAVDIDGRAYKARRRFAQTGHAGPEGHQGGNVERREELRAGSTAVAAIAAGFSKAFGTLIDTHVTTVVSCGFLFLFGTPAVHLAVSVYAANENDRRGEVANYELRLRGLAGVRLVWRQEVLLERHRSAALMVRMDRCDLA